MILAQLQHDLLIAQKEQNNELVSFLRYLMSHIKNAEIEKKRTITNDEVAAILVHQKKQLEEACVMFEKQSRKDLVAQYSSQITLIKRYLPQQLSEEEIVSMVKEIIKNNAEIAQKKPMALVGIAMKQIGARAPSHLVVDIVKRLT